MNSPFAPPQSLLYSSHPDSNQATQIRFARLILVIAFIVLNGVGFVQGVFESAHLVARYPLLASFLLPLATVAFVSMFIGLIKLTRSLAWNGWLIFLSCALMFVPLASLIVVIVACRKASVFLMSTRWKNL